MGEYTSSDEGSSSEEEIVEEADDESVHVSDSISELAAGTTEAANNSSCSHLAFMAETSNNEVHSKPACFKCVELEGKLERVKEHNLNLVCDLTRCKKANRVLRQHETEFKTTITTLKNDVSELSKTVIRKQDVINVYLDRIDEAKCE